MDNSPKYGNAVKTFYDGEHYLLWETHQEGAVVTLIDRVISPQVESRSVQRRKAAQRGEPAPEFARGVIGEADGTQVSGVVLDSLQSKKEAAEGRVVPTLRPPTEPSHPSIELTPTGLRVTGQPTFEDWKQAGALLGTLGESWKWCAGDWLILADDFGEVASQFIEEIGGSLGRLENLRWIARAFPESTRGRLSWTHHRTVAKLEPEKREEMLALAEENKWTTHELAAHLKPPSDTPICAHVFKCELCGARR